MAEKAKIAKPKGKAAKPAAQVQRKEQSKTARAEQSTSTSNFLSSIQGGAVQRKVNIGPANDKYEKEADSMADKVMQSSEPSVQAKHKNLSSLAVGTEGLLQKKESETEETEITTVQAKELTSTSDTPPIQAKEISSDVSNGNSLRNRITQIPQARASVPSARVHRKEDEDEIQKKSGSDVSRGPPAGGQFSSKLSQSKGGGQPMDGSTQSFMSSRFGADFSGVRIHTGSNAAAMSDSINAKAFTHQNDIYFNQGQYQPNTHAGKTLLAHELTHTIQQGAVTGSVQPKLKVGAPNDQFEQEADSMAAHVMRMPKEEEVQRKCSACEKEENVQRAALSDRGPPQSNPLHLSSNIPYPGSMIQRQAWEKEYDSDKETIQRKSLASSIQTRAGPGVVQRGLWDYVSGAVDYVVDAVEDTLDAGIDWVKEQLDDAASRVPGYMLLTVVLGENPITGRNVERNGRNFLEAGLDVIPNGDDYKRKMQEDGGYEDAVTWIDEQLELIDFSISDVARDFGNFVDSLSASDIASPGAALERGIAVFDRYVSRILTFAKNVALKLLEIVKDLAVNALLEWIKEETPWYPLLTVILGEDPITGDEVERNGMNILTGFISLHPEGEEQLRQMEESGSLQKAADWVDEAIVRVTRIAAGIKNGFLTMWEEFTITKLLTPVETFQEVYALFETPVTELIDFALEVAGMILQFIKDALIRRLVDFARTIPGYTLVTVILGKDIFSEEPVDRSAKNIIKGFMELVPGGTEKFNELDQTGAIDDAISWIEGAIEELDLTWEAVVTLFTTAWNEFSLADLATPIETFQRVMDLFAAPIGRVIRFVGKVIFKLVEIALRIMGFPFELIGSIIEQAQTAYEEIKRDPIQFLKNVLKAVKQGFIQFFDNILQHLINGVGEWLFGQLGDAGITIPPDFSFKSILNLVFQILGITQEKIFEKIREKVGPERWARIQGAIDTLTGIWTFVTDVITRGPIAIWEKIQEQLTGLWDMVISAARNWIMTKIVEQVTVKLLSLLDPTGIMAVVNSFIAFFNAVQSAIEYMIPMLEMLNSFLGGVVQIAQGNIQPAADLLERTMAQGMPILIGFLANQVGLGRIGDKIREVIESIQEKVDQGIQWLIDKAWELGQRMLNGLLGGSSEDTAESAGIKEEAKTEIDRQLANSENLESIEQVVDRVYQQLRPRGLRRLYVRDADNGDKEIIAEASPPRTLFKLVRASLGTNSEDATVRTAVTITLDPRGQNDPETELDRVQSVTATTSHGNEQQFASEPLPGVIPSNMTDDQGQDLGPNAISSRRPRKPEGSGPDFVNVEPVLHARDRAQGGSRGGSGGALFIPNQPDVVELMTWNTTGYDPTSGNNGSHAEKQFMNWYGQQNDDWKSRVNKIELANEPHSPCDDCSRDLAAFKTDALSHRPSGQGIEASISWRNVYRGTTSGGLAALAGKWRMFGPRPQGVLVRGAENLPRSPGSTAGAARSDEARISASELENNAAHYEILPQSFVQRKAKGSVASTPAELEADRMADMVIQRKELDELPVLPANKKRQEENKVEGGIMKLLGHKIQAKCKDCNEETVQAKCKACEEESIQRKCAKCSEEETVQRKAEGIGSGGFSSQLNASRGRGSPMDSSTRTFMESRFGTDFSGVKIHTDGQAADMNDQIHAKAFTHKNNIYFNQGEYNPGSDSGKRLLAHELTHTIQQGAVQSTYDRVQRKCSTCEDQVQRSTSGVDALKADIEAYRTSTNAKGGATADAIKKKVNTLLIRNTLIGVATVAPITGRGYYQLSVPTVMADTYEFKMSLNPRWTAGKAYVEARLNALAGPRRNEEGIKAELAVIKPAYLFDSLKVRKRDPKKLLEKPGWDVSATMGGKSKKVIASVDNMTGVKEGTAADPIPIKWYKPPKRYPKSVKLSNRKKTERKQLISTTNQLAYKKGTKTLNVMVGVQKGYNAVGYMGGGSHAQLVSEGDVITRTKSDRDGAPQRDYRKALTLCGYNWGHNDADHVLDLGFGGSDSFENLWPLTSRVNRRAYKDKYYFNYKVVRKVDATHSELKPISQLYGRKFKINGYFNSIPKQYPLGGIQPKLKDKPRKKEEREDTPDVQRKVLKGCKPKDKKTEEKQKKKAESDDKKGLKDKLKNFQKKVKEKLKAFKKKMANFFAEIKLKFRKLLKSANRKKFKSWGSGLMGALAGAAFKIIKVAGGIIIGQTFDLMKTAVLGKADEVIKNFGKDLKGSVPELEAKIKKMEDIYFGLRDKFQEGVADIVNKLVKPFESYLAEFERIKSTLQTIASLVNAAKWIYRILACVSPPLVGCLWIAVQALAEALMEKIVSSCKFQKRIAPVILKQEIVKDIPVSLANLTFTNLKPMVPNVLHDFFPTIKKSTHVPTPKLECGKQMTPEQEAFGKLMDELGEEKVAALRELFRKGGIPDSAPFTMSAAQNIINMVRSSGLSAEDLKELAKNYAPNTSPNVKNQKLVQLNELLEQLRDHTGASGKKKKSGVSKSGQLSNILELGRLPSWFTLEKNGKLKMRKDIKGWMSTNNLYWTFSNNLKVWIDSDASKVKLKNETLTFGKKKEKTQRITFDIVMFADEIPPHVTGISEGQQFEWKKQLIWRIKAKHLMQRKAILTKLKSLVEVNGSAVKLKDGVAGTVHGLGEVDAKILKIVKQKVKKGMIYYTIEIEPTKINEAEIGYFYKKKFTKFEVGKSAQLTYGAPVEKPTK